MCGARIRTGGPIRREEQVPGKRRCGVGARLAMRVADNDYFANQNYGGATETSTRRGRRRPKPDGATSVAPFKLGVIDASVARGGRLRALSHTRTLDM